MDIQLYESMFILREPVIHAAIRHLGLPAGSRGLDAGCNIGRITGLLAEAVSPGGQVTGLDIRSEYLEYARAQQGDGADTGHGGRSRNSPGARAQAAEQVAFVQGDVNSLPFEDNSFDWVWSMDTIWPGPTEFGCPAEDPIPLVKELTRVVKSGGVVALLYWSAQKLLPGHPRLEARLSCTSRALAPFTESTKPANHFMRCLSWLREAGTAAVGAHTFITDVTVPLSGAVRNAMTAAFPMFWSDVEGEVSAADWAEYKRLCSPGSPEFILDKPDYYAFFTYTMFHGKVI